MSCIKEPDCMVGPSALDLLDLLDMMESLSVCSYMYYFTIIFKSYRTSLKRHCIPTFVSLTYSMSNLLACSLGDCFCCVNRPK